MPLLIALFIVVPIVEMWAIIQVGGLIGVGPTIALLLLDSLLGAFLLRQQGRLSWARFRADALRRARAREGDRRRRPRDLRRRAAADARASSPTSSACCC